MELLMKLEKQLEYTFLKKNINVSAIETVISRTSQVQKPKFFRRRSDF
jgi:hypothetical protein